MIVAERFSSGSFVTDIDPIEHCAVWMLRRFGRPMSRAALRSIVARKSDFWSAEEFIEALESQSIQAEFRSAHFSLDDDFATTALLVRDDGQAMILTGERNREGSILILNPTFSDTVVSADLEDFKNWIGASVVEVRPPLRLENENEQLMGRLGHWFWGPILSARTTYIQVGIAALLTNIFALAASIFSMIVYDRVMPNGAQETLIALLVGISIVFASDFIIRSLRAYFLDTAGARADMIIADTLFERVVDVEMSARNHSIGSTISVMREFESLRDFLTSATLTVLIDIPFSIIFLFVIYSVAGPLVFVPMLIAPVVVFASIAVQPSLKRLVKTSQEDAQTKNSILVETLAGLETIKALSMGALMRQRWQEAVSHQAVIGLKTRMLSQIAGNVANLAGQVVWVGVVTYGFFLVQAGQIGTGAIVAASMLAGRVISPLAQLAQLLTRLNQSFASYHNLSSIMLMPRENGKRDAHVNFGLLKGAIEFQNVSFCYPGQTKGGLEDISFRINAGERVAFVGPVGSGKSTITKLILGLYKPTKGRILIDGIDFNQYDAAEIRSCIGAVMQDVWLFSGTVKENIAVGAEHPSDADILEAAHIACAHDFIANHPEGYGLRLKERGEGLSGGQRQAIAIARALVGKPSIVIFDEATSAFDINTERLLINRMNGIVQNKTLIVITHRASLFSLVDRIIVLQDGRMAAQGPKDEILRRFSQSGVNQ